VRKEAGTERIVVLGDSFTWGDKIASSDSTWPAQLEQQLRDGWPGRRIEVVNLCPGTDSRPRTRDGAAAAERNVPMLVLFPEFLPGLAADADLPFQSIHDPIRVSMSSLCRSS
jgi:hypothetical protein